MSGIGSWKLKLRFEDESKNGGGIRYIAHLCRFESKNGGAYIVVLGKSTLVPPCPYASDVGFRCRNRRRFRSLFILFWFWLYFALFMLLLSSKTSKQ